MKKAFIDRMLTIAISKKLTVFILATIFFYLGMIDSGNWIKLCFVYLGVQGSIDFYNNIKTK